MKNKSDRFYFDNFVEAAECCCHAADYLVECFNTYEPGQIRTMLKKMHVFEHDADTKKHEMSAALAKAFVTPIDREDLAMLSQNIDDVADNIEEVLQRFYVDQIQAVNPDAIAFAGKIVECCHLMTDMLKEFVNFKKSTKLHDMIVDLNHMEEECDEIYLEATLNIRNYSQEVLDVISWREIYDHMENCADACEHVGDCVEMVVMKNT